MENEYLIKVKRKVIDDLYAMHGMEAVEDLFDVMKEEMASYIKEKGEAYYSELFQNIREEILLNKKEKKNDTRMED